MSKWPEAHAQDQLGPFPWVSPAKWVAVLGGEQVRNGTRHMLGKPLALQNGAGGEKGVGLVPSSGFHLYSCSGLPYIRRYSNY